MIRPNKQVKHVNQPVHSNFAVKRLAISYDPPMIIIEYLVINTGKLYHHKIKLVSILERKYITEQQIIDQIKNKHSQYFNQDKIKDVQLIKLIKKLKNRITRQEKQNDENIAPVTLNKQSKSQKDVDSSYLNYSESQQNENRQKIRQITKINKQNPFLSQQKSNQNTLAGIVNQEQEEQQLNIQWDLQMDDNFDFI